MNQEAISIWQPALINGERAFVRPPRLPLGDHYSDRPFFYAQAEANCKRICFLGESVAAGYLYAPAFGPAKYLQSLLAHPQKEQFEVIDLARTNESLTGLENTFRQALQLKPDLMVCFAGNNWNMLECPEFSPYYPDIQARQKYAQLLKQGGIHAAIREAGRTCLRKIGGTLEHIAQLSKQADVKLIWLIPENNLLDWENRQAVPWLPNGKTAKWYKNLNLGLEKLNARQWDEAISIAWEMIEWDGGQCPSPYRILAKAFMGKGEIEKARDASQSEIDTNHYASLCFLGAPQIPSRFRELVQKASQRLHFEVLDLKEIFSNEAEALIPDRRLFLDYCHLSKTGIALAMKVLCEKIFRMLECEDQIESIQTVPPIQLDPAQEAVAAFGAAIHTAHRMLALDKTDILDHWIRKALQIHPFIREAMIRYVLQRLCRDFSAMSKFQLENLASIHKLEMQHGWKYPYLDPLIIQSVLSNIDDPKSLINHPAWTLIEIKDEGLELIDEGYFLWQPVERIYYEVMAEATEKKTSYRAFWPESRFAFWERKGRDIRMNICLRSPLSTKGKFKGQLRCNDQYIGTIDIGSTWSNNTYTISAEMLKEGLNQICILWPTQIPDGKEALNKAIERLENGLLADIHPVFGEIISLQLFPANSVQSKFPD